MFKKTLVVGLFFTMSIANAAEYQHEANTIKKITVNSDLRQKEEKDTSGSISVFTSNELQERGVAHFSDLLLQVPNVNFSGQNSRARHIIIRGMGERDEYTGAPNPTVGFSIDGIDLSGVGGVGNLFDVKQVEVLRGPQSTRYGSNAIGGLVNINSNEPSQVSETVIENTIGTYGLREFGVSNTGSLNLDNEALYRVSFFKHDSDGFMNNKTLKRKNTDGKDELSFKGKLRYWTDGDAQVDISAIFLNMDNGYDAFSRDNTYITRSDEPGQDFQETQGLSVKYTQPNHKNFTFMSNTSIASSKMIYSYDEDWTERTGNFYRNDKERLHFSQEIRFISNTSLPYRDSDWLAGLYFSRLNEKNKSSAAWLDSSKDFFHNKAAIFGQFDVPISGKSVLTLGSRLEKVSYDFKNNDDESFKPSDFLAGGSLTYTYYPTEMVTLHAGVSRGYKMGGFNTGIKQNDDLATFDAEYVNNYELGLKLKTNKLSKSTTVFYMDRENPQFDGYTYNAFGQFEYVLFTENLDSAKHYGVESEINFYYDDTIEFFSSFGIIKTKINGTPVNSQFAIKDRETAHTPNYQYLAGVVYRSFSGLITRLEMQGMGSFYYDNVHNKKSKPYNLINGRIGYETKNFDVYVWGKNLTDNVYTTRGYFFDHFDGQGEQLYTRLGDRRVLGLTTRIRF